MLYSTKLYCFLHRVKINSFSRDNKMNKHKAGNKVFLFRFLGKNCVNTFDHKSKKNSYFRLKCRSIFLSVLLKNIFKHIKVLIKLRLGLSLVELPEFGAGIGPSILIDNGRRHLHVLFFGEFSFCVCQPPV